MGVGGRGGRGGSFIKLLTMRIFHRLTHRLEQLTESCLGRARVPKKSGHVGTFLVAVKHYSVIWRTQK